MSFKDWLIVALVVLGFLALLYVGFGGLDPAQAPVALAASMVSA